MPAIAALTVLDALQDNRIPERALETGDYVRERLRELARSVVAELRERGILIGRTGAGGNVLKIRPPLIWTTRQADELMTGLEAALERVLTAR